MSTPKKSDTSAVHLWLVLWKAFHSVEQISSRSIAGFEMHPTDFGVLEALLHKGPLTARELGQKVLLTSGSMTAAIDRLEERGLLTRVEGSEDRRGRVISLTPEGKALIEPAFREHAQHLERALKEVPEGERFLLLNLLRSLGRTAEQSNKEQKSNNNAA